MKKIIIISFITMFLSTAINAGTDGNNFLSSKNSEDVKDCFEGLNRATFALNQSLDKIIFEPAAKLYRFLPSPVRSGTNNALNNLSNLVTVPNNLLQGDLILAGENTARFIINSTVGVLGIFDVATAMGFEKYEKEDYGQTLAVHGVKDGCYLVLPVLGPSTARDTVASLASFIGGDAWYNITVNNDTHYVTDFDYYASRLTAGIDFRAKNLEAFENLEKNSMDFYASVRSLYLQDRKQKILNSKKITETQDDSDWEEIETQ